MAYRRKSRGMSEYPGYYCYDSDRPSWLPYWIDDITESVCKYSPSTIAGNIKACVAGDPSCGTPTPEQANPALPGAGTVPAGTVAVNVPQCSGLYTLNPATNACEINVLGNPLFLIGGGLILAFALVGRR